MPRKSEADELEALLEKGMRLPAQPQVVVEIQQLLAAEEPDVRKITQILARDPGIVAMLFKLVSTPAYGGRRIDSLTKAVQLVGVRQIANLVRGIALTMTVPGVKQPIYDKFWRRCTGIAEFAAGIAAERISVCNIFPDQAYLAGIFHDCGVPMLLERFPDYCAALRTGTGQWIDVIAEDQRFDVDHAVVGHLIARHWRLPDFIAEAVLKHHEMPPADTGGAARSMVAILQLANELYHREQLIPNPEWPNQRHAVMAELCIHEGELESFMDDLLESTYA